MDTDKITQIIGKAIPMPGDDIDTDRVIPARFLKALTFEGMEKGLFCDERERTPDHPIDNPDHKGAVMMFVGKNFGSGSSREHAPQAIKRFGIRALVGVSFAEIFSGNCFAIGVPLATVSPEDAERLIKKAQDAPATVFTLDIDALRVRFGDEEVPVEILKTQRSAFLAGTWDMLANLRANLDQVREVAGALPYVSDFKG